METIPLDGPEEASQYSLKKEEPWTDDHENLLKKWRGLCEELAEKHGIKAKRNKMWHTAIKLPAVAIPVIMAPIATEYKDYENISQVNLAGFVITAFLNAYYNFYNFQEKKEKHDQHASQYSDLITTIDLELSRQKIFREPADRFFEKIQAAIDFLEKTSPDLY